jgi:hypothetical protein
MRRYKGLVVIDFTDPKEPKVGGLFFSNPLDLGHASRLYFFRGISNGRSARSPHSFHEPM